MLSPPGWKGCFQTTSPSGRSGVADSRYHHAIRSPCFVTSGATPPGPSRCYPSTSTHQTQHSERGTFAASPNVRLPNFSSR